MIPDTPKSELPPANQLQKVVFGGSLYQKTINRFFYSFLFKFIPRKLKFKLIYHFNLWSSPESISGPGSELLQTLRVKEFLTRFIKEYQIKSILDIPCGDFNWMKTMDLNGVDYLGGDIVEKIIEANNKTFKKENIRFEVMDIIGGKLIAADLIIVRDLLIHFSVGNIHATIANVKRSRIKYILVSTYPDSKVNKSIRDGYNFNINLQIAPFNFGKPLFLIEEMKDDNLERKCVGLWKVEDLITVQPS